MIFRALLTSLGLLLVTTGTQAQTSASLAPDLARLLDAAAASDNQEDFPDAVRLLALTASPEAVLAASEQLGRGVEAREVLGVPAALAQMDTAPALPATPTGTTSPERVWLAAPMAVAGAVASGQSDLWEGRVGLGLRFDSGNSDRKDYAVNVTVQRALAGWGFEGSLDYAYSEVDSAIGRDEFAVGARGERELGERWTAFAIGEYERDALSGYDWTAFTGAGFGYRVLDSDRTSLVLRASPGARFQTPINADTQTSAALNLGADFATQLSETVQLSSETDFLLTDQSRADQVFAISTALGELWSLEFKFHYRYELEPEPGFEQSDTRTDVSIVRVF